MAGNDPAMISSGRRPGSQISAEGLLGSPDFEVDPEDDVLRCGLQQAATSQDQGL